MCTPPSGTLDGDAVHPGQQDTFDTLKQTVCMAAYLHNATAAPAIRVGKVRDVANPAGRHQVAEKPGHQAPGWLLYQLPDLSALLQNP
nr:hypothetical protein [Alcaligenes faecalis]